MTWSSVWPYLLALDLVLIGVGVFYVLFHPREPRAMLAWIMTFIALPLLGTGLFFLLSDPSLNRRRRRLIRFRKRLNPALWKKLRALHEKNSPAQHFAEASKDLQKFIALATRISPLQPPTANNTVTLYHHRAKALAERLREAILAAEQHVHLEYFIFRADDYGNAIADALMQRARAGVQCRLLIDHIGCLHLPEAFIDALREAGVEVTFFMPVVPWRGRRWGLRPNSRNHRKIAVIDGRLGLVGSQNIGDEYLSGADTFSTWVDTHLEITGPAVYQLQEIFIEDWHAANGEELYYEAAFPPLAQTGSGDEIVQIVASAPSDEDSTMHHLLLAAISSAEHSVCIATPSFVPDYAMVLLLKAAAYRGVKVQLMLPQQTDQRITRWIGHSYYQELGLADVEIYEYSAGFLHSKLVIVDQGWGLVGSANLDERSFRVNFEVTTILYTEALTRQLQQDFDHMLQHSQHIKPSEMPDDLLTRLKSGAARLMSPLY
ncbi:MAG: cardiolipin synthase [Gammaproteobacteria bacterium]